MPFEDLFGVGYRGLVLLHEEQRESPSQRDDYYDETFAALDIQGLPVKVSVHSHHNVFQKSSWNITSRVSISLEEYEALKLARGVQDTPEWCQNRAKEERLAAQREKLKEESFPRCPGCRRQMVLRQNSKNKTWFFGCESYPKCTGTRPVSDDLRAKLKKLGML